MSSPPSDDELRRLVAEELSRPDVDLSVVTRKSMRLAISAKLGGVDLKPRKKIINEAIHDFLAQGQDPAKDHEEKGGRSEVKAEAGGDAPGVTVTKKVTDSAIGAAGTAIGAEQKTESEEEDDKEGGNGAEAGEDDGEIDAVDMALSDSDIEDLSPSEWKRKQKTKRASKSSSKAGTSTAKRKSASKATTKRAASGGKLYRYDVELTELDRLNEGRTPYNYLLELEPPLAEFLDETYLTRSEVVKRIWAYCREKEFPLSKGSRVLDERLAGVLGRKTISFKTLSKAIKPLMKRYHKPEKYTKHPEANALDNGGAKAKRAKKAATPSSEKSKSGKKPGGGGGGLMAVKNLSPELAAIVGVSEAPRTEVVKRLWGYIREHELQDSKDRRRILCDDTMRQVFPDEMTAFSMNKYISPHLS